METSNSFGYWIRRQRKALDLTQQVLADRVGCSLAAIKKIESDERRPSRQIADLLANVLGVPANQRELFLEIARGIRPIDQLPLAQEPLVSVLPTGLVTFLFTDIENSTKLAQAHPEEWETLRARHHAILRETMEAHHGYVFQVIGDAFCVAFDTANDAFQAAIKAQRKLQSENWGEVPLKVRTGIHTGEAEAHDHEYRGYLTLSLVQRLMSAGHGKQILLSQATENLLRGYLPKDISLLDLGEHKFKDIFQPIRVFQVIAPDLQIEFPALRALDVFPNNLPIQLTSFIERGRELVEVKQLLSNTRLLTLTGPGGTGKTRLSLQIAQDVLSSFTNGVWLVELAPLTDPSLIPQTIASVFELREAPKMPLTEIITNYLRAKQLLLILDNCEHLIAACAKLSDDLLHVCPQLKIIASSREALGISGETIYRVPPLSLPNQAQVTREAIADYESVQLFVERATAVQSHFALMDSNASAVIQICHRLDGIPLALELAAARIAVFSPEEIASRLDDRFRLLTGGSRTALERHQTLRALIDWSYDLLSDEERILFRQLSVFAGGWTFEAAEAVCPDLDVLNLLTQLINKSLVMVDADARAEGTRYRLPETIRQYAREKLLESGESKHVCDHHLEFFLRFAETAEPKLRSAEQLEWLGRVETEHDNLRTALAWSLESKKSDRPLELSGALTYFWHIHGYWSEGKRWLAEALALDGREQSSRTASAAGEHAPSRTESARRAKALNGAGLLRLGSFTDLDTLRPGLEESLRLWRALKDKWWMAVVLLNLGQLSIFEGDHQKARAQLEEAVALARQVEDKWALAAALDRLGGAMHRIDARAALPILDEAVAVARAVGDNRILTSVLLGMASTHYLQGDLKATALFTEEAMAAARAIGSKMEMEMSLLTLAIVAVAQGDPAKATAYSMQLLALTRETGLKAGAMGVLLSLGCVACASGQVKRGVQLLAAVESLARRAGMPLAEAGGLFVYVYKQYMDRARAQLDAAAFDMALQEGQSLTPEQALALATENKDEDSSLPKT